MQTERLAAHGKQITAEVMSALQPFVDHGVNHFIIYNYAYAVKTSVAAGYLLEQRRLMRLLKKLTPGVLAVNSRFVSSVCSASTRYPVARRTPRVPAMVLADSPAGMHTTRRRGLGVVECLRTRDLQQLDIVLSNSRREGKRTQLRARP